MKGKIGLLAFWQWSLALVSVLGLGLADVSHQALAAGGTWTAKEPLPYPCYGAAAGVIDGKLYVAGGVRYTPDGLYTIVDNSLQVYNSGTWTTLASMPTRRYAAAAGVIEGILYVVGGDDSYGPMSTVEAYNPSLGTWTTKADLPSPTSFAAAGVINGKLYLADDGNQLFIYTPGTPGTWVTSKSPRRIRNSAAAGVFNGRLYLVGGSSDEIGNGGFGLTTVEAYDPATDTWVNKTPMTHGRAFLGVGVIDNVLYAVGGSDIYSASLPTVEAYDPVKDTWTTVAPMLTPRSLAAAGVINNSLYVVGGQYENEDDWLIYLLSSMEAFTPPSAYIPVTIDIKPGEYPKSINLGSNGKVPVAILSTDDFDANQVDPLSVTLAGASVVLKGKGTPMASLQDVNGDGRLDLVVQVDTQSFQLSVGDTEAVLEGHTVDGKAFRGTDTVRIVP